MNSNWNDAAPLDFAWFELASKEAKNRWRDSGALPERAAIIIRHEMCLELVDRLAKGELLAFGVATFPIPRDSAEAIPPIFFQSHFGSINWDSCEISGFKRIFEDVRITEISKQELPIKTIAEKSPLSEKRGGGRPNQYPKVKWVLDELWQIPEYRDMRAAKLREPFNSKFQQQFSSPDERIPPVSERSFREHLKRYRQELAETGNN